MAIMTEKKYETTSMDKKADKKEAAKRKEPLKAWESSKADAKMDKAAVKKLNKKKRKGSK